MSWARRSIAAGLCAGYLAVATSLLPAIGLDDPLDHGVAAPAQSLLGQVALAQDLPAPMPVTLDPNTTAVFVLDLSARCNDPEQTCSELIPGLSQFLPRARAAGAFIVYTVSSSTVGTPLSAVADGIDPGPNDVVLHPDGFNKFVDPELQALLDAHGITTIVMTGASSNVAILYTATSATRDYGYNVVIAEDGINAASSYEEDYTLHQFTVLPGGVQPLFSYSDLDMISF